MNFKRFFSLILVLALCLTLVAAVTGCDSGASKKKLYIFNCGDYIAPEITKLFEKEFPQYKVVYDTYDTNETMYQKLVSTNIPYDIIVPSDYMVERLIKENRLMKLDYSKIPNYQYIRESLKGLDYDPNEEYTVPYMWGTLGIVYNKKLVSEPVTSWDILWDPKYEGQILMLDSVRDSMGIALEKLGYSMNSTDPDEIAAAGKALLEQKPLVKQYGVDNIKDPMINGHYALCVEWSGDALWMMNQNEDLEYVVPRGGANIWVDSMVIPTSSQNYEGALEFINFICRTDIAVMNAEYIEYSTPSTAALEELGDEYINNHVFNPSDEELEGTYSFLDVGDAIEYYNKAWEELRLSTDRGMSKMVIVYVAAAVVVIGLVVFFIIRKKKRDSLRYD